MIWSTSMPTFAFIVFTAASPALALEIRNTDEREHTIALVVGDSRSEVKVPSGAEINVQCDPDCIVSFVTQSGDEDSLEAIDTERLTIRNGAFEKSD